MSCTLLNRMESYSPQTEPRVCAHALVVWGEECVYVREKIK